MTWLVALLIWHTVVGCSEDALADFFASLAFLPLGLALLIDKEKARSVHKIYKLTLKSSLSEQSFS